MDQTTKNQHREYSLVLYCMEIVDFRTLYLLVTWSFLCWYYSMVEEWSVLSLIISFQGHLVHIFFLVLNLAPLDKDYFKTIVANYLSWLSIIPEFHHSVQLRSSKLEIVIIWFLWRKKLQSCKLLMKKNIEMTVEIKFSGTSN